MTGTVGVFVRSTLFALAQAVATPLFWVIAMLTFPLPLIARYRVISTWSRLMIFLARTLCGIRYRIEGREHIPQQPCIVLSKHQSAWETLAFQIIFPPQVWVIKRELLRVPFFGWGLAMLKPIAIDRGAALRALRMMAAQAHDRLERGFWIVVFPEGTRTASGTHGKFHVGGAWLAAQTGAPVLPVALNAGELWGRHAFLKYPGTITVRIGAPLAPQTRKADDLNREAESWIRSQTDDLTGMARDRTRTA
jgi:1-acyl-sn-glycerol-3-phosphate acyltransferase